MNHVYTNPLAGLVEDLHDRASVRTVFGDPVVTEDRTTIPVARVAYGFGGGYGSAAGARDSGKAFRDAAAADESGEGAGMGGGISVTPVGVVEVTAADTRFVRFDDRRRSLLVALLAFGLGLLVGRVRSRPGA